ncbi:MAG: hypothetical protein KDK71_00380 [Chlamydiia bacterium]|nr:hypothetical protein [Chlamydiia bacterium]
MTTLTEPNLQWNSGSARWDGKGSLLDNVNWKVGNVGDHANTIARHVETLYKEHNKLVGHVDQGVSKMIKELNAKLIEAIAPQISDRAKVLLQEDPRLLQMLAEAIISSQQETIDLYKNKVQELEKRVTKLEERARL